MIFNHPNKKNHSTSDLLNSPKETPFFLTNMDFQAASNYYLEFLTLLITTSIILPIIGVIGVFTTWYFSQKYTLQALSKQVKARHCLVTGGSQGLGKSLAIKLVQAGAHVTILARSESKLKDTTTELIKHKINPDQIVQYFSVDLINYNDVVKVVGKLNEVGQNPYWLICNAGSSISGYLNDQIPIQVDGKYKTGCHEWMMSNNYLTTVNVVQSVMQVSKQGTGNKVSGITFEQREKLPVRIILVGSIMSVLSMIGYSAYSASKYALRGFADALRSELAPLGIKVSLYFPGNMDTPGYEQENLDKPRITKQIEGASMPVTADSAADSLLGSILNDRYYISNDILGEFARVSVNGGAPRPNLLFEVIL
jgi:short-subunit dehydrogenase